MENILCNLFDLLVIGCAISNEKGRIIRNRQLLDMELKHGEKTEDLAISLQSWEIRLFLSEESPPLFLRMIEDKTKKLKVEYDAIIDSIYDEILVTDATGIVVSVNKACEKFYNKKAEDIIGKHVKDLEKQGVFWPSVTEIVFRTKKNESMLQTTKSGRKVLVSAIPILSENNEIIKVVNNSRDLTELIMLKKQLEEQEQLVNQISRKIIEMDNSEYATEKLIYVNATMEKIHHLIEKVAASDISILILGESGVGKTLIAETIHNKSTRRKGPFQVINCSAIPETLLESELFGYEGGAFTGALKQGKAGLFELAQGGSIFLDEIGELSTTIQAKLLQVIQERKFRKIGGIKSIEANFRMITATNQDLTQKLENKTFREDFYYRINGITINLPPLRERKEDILVLANVFLEQANRKYEANKKFSGEVVEVFCDYSWPGNIRELKHMIERLCLVSEYDLIMLHDLPEKMLSNFHFAKKRYVQQNIENIMPLSKAVEMLEDNLVNLAYRNYRNTYKVAEILGVSQPTAHRLIKKYVNNSNLKG